MALVGVIVFAFLGISVYAVVHALLDGTNIWLAVFWPLQTASKIFAWAAKKDPAIAELSTISQDFANWQTSLATQGQNLVDLNAKLDAIVTALAAKGINIILPSNKTPGS